MKLGLLMAIYWRVQLFRYERSKGKKMNTLYDQPIFILHTIGQKTGKLRKKPLIYFKKNEDYLIVASNGGSKKHPSWYHNLKVVDHVNVQIKDKILKLDVKIAPSDEKEKLWKYIIGKCPYYDEFPKRTSRKI